MDEQTEAYLKRVLEKDLHELTPEDKAFLKARWSYVGRRSRDRLGAILEESTDEPRETEEVVEVKTDVPFPNLDEDGQDEV